MTDGDIEAAHNKCNGYRNTDVSDEISNVERTPLQDEGRSVNDKPATSKIKPWDLIKDWRIIIITLVALGIIAAIAVVVALSITRKDDNPLSEINPRPTFVLSTAKGEASLEDQMIKCGEATSSDPDSLPEECKWLFKNDFGYSESDNPTKQFLCKDNPHVLPNLCKDWL